MVASSKTLIQYHSQDIISGKGHHQNKETLAHPCLLYLYSQYTTQGISLQPSQGRTDKEYVVNSHNGILVSCKEEWNSVICGNKDGNGQLHVG
jgi:hypothetical protein